MSDFTLVYVSTSSKKWTAQDLAAIGRTASERNAMYGISGMLLYSGSHFIQVLEGHEYPVSRLFTLINGDPRHFDIERLLFEPIEQRVFGRWHMGVLDLSNRADLNRDTLRTICGHARRDPAAAGRAALKALIQFRQELPAPDRRGAA